MSPRVYVRKFDWDEARARYAAGESIRALADEYGVTAQRVWQVVRPGEIERMKAYKKEWQTRGRCDDCGGPMNNMSRVNGSRHCVPCAARLRATSVREGELQCVTCKEWKPDEDFQLNRTEHARRGRHSQCRLCNTAARRDHRRRNREKANTYDREYKRRRRAKQVAA